MMEVNDRVTIKDHDFLSDGYVLEVLKSINACIIKLDEKAPKEYSWITDEILIFNNHLFPVYL